MSFILYLSCKSQVSKERNVNVWKLTNLLNWKRDYCYHSLGRHFRERNQNQELNRTGVKCVMKSVN